MPTPEFTITAEEQALREAQAARWQGVTLQKRELANRAIRRRAERQQQRAGVTIIAPEQSYTSIRQGGKIVVLKAARGLAKMLHMNKTVDRINNAKI